MGDEEEPLLIEYKAKNGEILVFDITPTILIPFGFNYADRVATPKGAATVIGVREGCMWFHIDGDTGASFWDNGKSYETLLKVGINLLEIQPMVIDLTEKNGVYKLKRISYKDKNVNVILQNENGPCPLISISNVLALRGDITISAADETSRSIDIDVIKTLLSDLLTQRYAEAKEETKKQVQKAIDQLPNLQTGMDVNFGFVEPSSFEKSDQSQLFELLGVRLVHGWLVDPVDTETHAVIGTNTYNDLMNKLVALDQPNPSSNSASSNSAYSLSNSATSVNTTTTTSPTPTEQQTSQTPLSSSTSSSNVAQPNEPAPAPADTTSTVNTQTPTESPKPAHTSSSLSNSQSGENKAEQKKAEEVKPPTARDFAEGDIISSFLNQTSSQLTSHGLNVLQQIINEDELCVFFRNNHFSTITRHDSQLYILVTDIGYEKERTIVWDLLNSVDGTSIFVTGDFKPTDEEKKDEVINTLEIMGWTRAKIEECYKQAPRDKLVNADDAIGYLAQMLGPQT